MAVWGGLTNSCEKKRSEKQRRKGKIYPFECRVSKNSKEIKKSFLSDQCKEIEENNRMGNTRESSRKLEISSLSHSIVLLYFFALITRKAFLFLLAILWNSAFRCLYRSFSPLLFISFLFTAICKASPDSHFAFLHYFFLGMVLIPVSYTMSRTSIHSSYRHSSIISSPLNLFETSTE